MIDEREYEEQCRIIGMSAERELFLRAENDRLRARVAELEAEREWQPIETAPKDVPILAWCDHEADPFIEGTTPDGRTRLTLYAAHAEGLSHAPDGLNIIEWGGGFSESQEDGGGWLPDWWFVVGSEFEKAANPIYWMPLPAPPQPELEAGTMSDQTAQATPYEVLMVKLFDSRISKSEIAHAAVREFTRLGARVAELEEAITDTLASLAKCPTRERGVGGQTMDATVARTVYVEVPMLVTNRLYAALEGRGNE